MSDYSELIKNFSRIRDYMRDFFIFGFKSRKDFSAKSPRTYDNEKRRIESYLGELAKWEYSEKGKNIFISVDSVHIAQNPFYKAFKTKSFTHNDIVLHFLILDILTSSKKCSLEEITDKINLRTREYTDTQTIRNKLKKYHELGIINIQKEKKSYSYSLAASTFEELAIPPEAISFFSETAPFGVIGSYINDTIHNQNTKFQYKHHFIINTLEDIVLLDLINAMQHEKTVSIETFSKNNKEIKNLTLLPLKIYVSVQTGRRYLLAHNKWSKKFSTFRLDYIKNVKLLEKDDNFSALQKKLTDRMHHSFATTVMQNNKPEHIEITFFINEKTEKYIIARILREGRCGNVEKIKPHTYKFSADVSDTNELTPWIKTFTGRIIRLAGNNETVINKFYSDIDEMAKLYSENCNQHAENDDE